MSKATSHQSVSALAKTVGVQEIFGPPPLLEGESPAAYEKLLQQVTAAVAPADIIEEIWVRDFVDVTWEIMRLRRMRPPLVLTGYGAAVAEIYTIEYGAFKAHDLTEKWLRDEEGVRDAFYELLSELGLGIDDVHARAIAHKIKVLERVDRMTENAEHRRRLLYAEIERRRDVLARRLREAAQTIDAQIEQEGAASLPRRENAA